MFMLPITLRLSRDLSWNTKSLRRRDVMYIYIIIVWRLHVGVAIYCGTPMANSIAVNITIILVPPPLLSFQASRHVLLYQGNAYVCNNLSFIHINCCLLPAQWGINVPLWPFSCETPRCGCKSFQSLLLTISSCQYDIARTVTLQGK